MLNDIVTHSKLARFLDSEMLNKWTKEEKKE